MNETLVFLAAPFVMCLVLLGIHCYLGLHVLARGVIFVDLALAQVAVLGGTLAYFWGYEHHESESYFIALAATLLAALFLALASRVKSKISPEAVIGILNAFAAAAVVLTVDKMSHGAEHIKYALVGQVLWVTWEDVLKVFAIYSGVAVLHIVFRKQLIANSFGKGSHWFWDFLFYGLFGVVITSSVSVAGILLVFAFLIVPALTGVHFFKTLRSQLMGGWSVGLLLCTVGMALSYRWDLPAGAFMVFLFTLWPLLFISGAALRSFARK